MAFNELEYAAPAVAVDKDVVVMVSGGGAGGVTVTDAVADLVGSAALVAVTVAVVFTVTEGALYIPLLEIVPGEADQVTATFDVFDTSAVNCSVPLEATVEVAGVRVTAMLRARSERPLESRFSTLTKAAW